MARGHPAESNPGTGERREVGAVPPRRQSLARYRTALQAKGRLQGRPFAFSDERRLLASRLLIPGIQPVDVVLRILRSHPAARGDLRSIIRWQVSIWRSAV